MPECPRDICQDHELIKTQVQDMQESFKDIIKDLRETTNDVRTCINHLTEIMKTMDVSRVDIVNLRERVVKVEKEMIETKTAEKVSAEMISRMRRDIALTVMVASLVFTVIEHLFLHWKW